MPKVCPPGNRFCLTTVTVVIALHYSLLGFSVVDSQSLFAQQAETLAQEKASETFSADQLEFFETKVRPLLHQHCAECHGEEAKRIEGGFRLVSRESLLAGGDTGPAIDVGKPESSLLIDAINYGETYQMPPAGMLAQADIDILTEWVRNGAAWTPSETAAKARVVFDLEQRKSDHWVWKSITKPQVPSVRIDNWPLDPIDAFVLEKLEQHKLTPNEDADRSTWLNRAHLDLIGLPPSTETLNEFLADKSDQAYERAIDRLLQSQHFGERMARRWMDLTRYAETCGHEFDYPIPHAYQYRDYLIRAFNSDVPYDQLVVEHLAGDLVPNPRRNPETQIDESLIGTGFWFLNEATHAPVDVREDQAGHIDNRIDVFSKTFLGLTLACARCHDHKFDAISTQDYYAMAGFLRSSYRQQGMLDPAGKIAAARKDMGRLQVEADQLISDTLVAVKRFPADSFAQYLQAATALVKPKLSQNLDLATIDFAAEIHQQSIAQKLDEALLKRFVTSLSAPRINQPEHPLFFWSQSVLRTPEFNAAQLIQSAKDHQSQSILPTDESCLDFRDFRQALTLTWPATGEAFSRVGSDKIIADLRRGNAFAAPFGVVHSGLASGKFQGVMRSPTFEIQHDFIDYFAAGEGARIRLIIEGYDMDAFSGLLFSGAIMDVNTGGEFQWLRQGGDISRYKGHRAHIELIDQGNGWLALQQVLFTNGPRPTQISTLSAELANSDIQSVKSEAEFALWLGQQLQSDLELQRWAIESGAVEDLTTFAARWKQLDEDKKPIEDSIPAPTLIQAMVDGTPTDSPISIRGNYRTPGATAPRRFLTAIDGASAEPLSPFASGRWELAQRLIARDNPLVARAMANRLWYWMTGQGIVSSTDNLGVLGQAPTHPELLDYLAAEFMDEGWSIKRMLKRIVLSHTYRQSSVARPASIAIDAENKWLHAMRIRRLEGEIIRDKLLAVSGDLDETLFGSSVPIHLTPFMQGRGTPGSSGPIDGARRRSLYIEVRRNFLSPFMMAFDTPNPFTSVGRRNVSNLPAQALILMNDPFVREQAAHWANRLLADSSLDTRGRIEKAHRAAFARSANAEEFQLSMEFLINQAKELGIPSDQVESNPQVWQDYCHALINVKEFIYVN
jgi:mono/diheme cytochrome c family protein